MLKHSVFAGAVFALMGVITFQSMRAADAVPNAAQTRIQTVSPMELMRNAGDLPAERIDYPY